MINCRIKDLTKIFEKSNLQASEGKDKGNYPFYTSSSVLSKYYDDYLYEGNAITMGTGGMASINYVDQKFATSTDCYNFTANEYTKFVYYYLLSQLKEINDIGFQGMGLKHLQKDYINTMKITIPDDYKRITNFLDKKVEEIDNVIEKTKETIEDYRKYKQAIITELVTKGLDKNVEFQDTDSEWIGKIPKHWKYVRINTLLNDYVLFDDLLYGNKIRMDKPMVEWPRIWQAKIDYMEKQMKELGVGKEVLIHSFSYYIGLGENAISYYNYNKPVSKNISMCHFRMNNPILPVNYYHPLSLILDYDVRDYAEYFKVSFFNEMLDMKEVSKFIFDNRYDYNDMILFYSRMLYPTYYFDLFERSITDNVLEKRIMDVITKSDKYEMLLKDIYYEIRKKYNIPGVDWLIKKSN